MKPRAAVLAALGLAAAACTGGPAPFPDGPVDLEFWYTVGAQGGETMVRLVDEFNASQDWVHVDAVFQGTTSDAVAKLAQAAAAGDLPNLFQADGSSTVYLRDTGLFTAPEEAGFDPAGLVPVMRDFYTLDGGLAAVPVMTSQTVLLYNPELLGAAGLDPATPPAEPGDLFDYAARIHAATGVWGLSAEFDSHYVEELSAALGVATCLPDNGLAAPATAFQFASEPQVQLWAGFADLVAQGAYFNAGTDRQAAIAAFTSGEAALNIQSTGAYSAVVDAAEFDVGVWPLPAVPGGGVFPGGSALWLVSEGATAEEQSAAARFAAYLAGPEAQRRVFVEVGYMPSDQAALDGLLEEANGGERSMLQQLQSHPLTPVALGCHAGPMGEVRQEVRAAMEQIAAGADVREALEQAEAAADESLARYAERLPKPTASS
jgi:sn-glycerol 3-phosphate transport system substrate-binding protein